VILQGNYINNSNTIFVSVIGGWFIIVSTRGLAVLCPLIGNLELTYTLATH